MCKVFVLFFYLFWFVKSFEIPNYCSPNIRKVCGNKPLYACQVNYQCPGISGCHPYGAGMTFREELLHAHNDFRNMVANGTEQKGTNEGASNMNALEYDLELEYLAQCWANVCSTHKDKGCQRVNRFPFEQNIYQYVDRIEVGGIDYSAGVKFWYDQIINIDQANIIDKYPPRWDTKPADMYTQLVWAKTKYLGCALGKRHNNYTLVCNYGPAGNKIGFPVYLRTQSDCSIASKCKSRHSKYKSLCGDNSEIKTCQPWIEIPYKTFTKIDDLENFDCIEMYETSVTSVATVLTSALKESTEKNLPTNGLGLGDDAETDVTTKKWIRKKFTKSEDKPTTDELGTAESTIEDITTLESIMKNSNRLHLIANKWTTKRSTKIKETSTTEELKTEESTIRNMTTSKSSIKKSSMPHSTFSKSTTKSYTKTEKISTTNAEDPETIKPTRKNMTTWESSIKKYSRPESTTSKLTTKRSAKTRKKSTLDTDSSQSTTSRWTTKKARTKKLSTRTQTLTEKSTTHQSTSKSSTTTSKELNTEMLPAKGLTLKKSGLIVLENDQSTIEASSIETLINDWSTEEGVTTKVSPSVVKKLRPQKLIRGRSSKHHKVHLILATITTIKNTTSEDFKEDEENEVHEEDQTTLKFKIIPIVDDNMIFDETILVALMSILSILLILLVPGSLFIRYYY